MTWKESFDKLLSSQSKSSPTSPWVFLVPEEGLTRAVLVFSDGLCLFRAFLVSEFSEENIAFYLACEDYKETKPSKLAAKAGKIYDEFICANAPREVSMKYSAGSPGATAGRWT